LDWVAVEAPVSSTPTRVRVAHICPSSRRARRSGDPVPSSQARLLDRRAARGDEAAPIIPILARKVREVEAKAARGKVGPTNRTRFQVIALLVREERARVKNDPNLSSAARAELLKRLDGVATILARTAARDTSLLT